MTDKEGGLGEQIEEMQKYFFWGGGDIRSVYGELGGEGKKIKHWLLRGRTQRGV